MHTQHTQNKGEEVETIASYKLLQRDLVNDLDVVIVTPFIRNRNFVYPVFFTTTLPPLPTLPILDFLSMDPKASLFPILALSFSFFLSFSPFPDRPLLLSFVLPLPAPLFLIFVFYLLIISLFNFL